MVAWNREGIYASTPQSNADIVPDLGLTLLPGSQTQAQTSGRNSDRLRWKVSPRVTAKSTTPTLPFLPSSPNLHFGTASVRLERDTANKTIDRLHQRNRHLTYERDKYLNACETLHVLDPVTKKPKYQVLTDDLRKTSDALRNETSRANAWRSHSTTLVQQNQQNLAGCESWKKQAEYWKQEADRWRLRSEISSTSEDRSLPTAVSSIQTGRQITPPDSTRASTPSISSLPGPVIDLTHVSHALNVWNTIEPSHDPKEARAALKRKAYAWVNDNNPPGKQPRFELSTQCEGRKGPQTKTGFSTHAPSAAEINASMVAYEQQVQKNTSALRRIPPSCAPAAVMEDNDGQDTESDEVVPARPDAASSEGMAEEAMVEGNATEEENEEDDDWLRSALEEDSSDVQSDQDQTGGQDGAQGSHEVELAALAVTGDCAPGFERSTRHFPLADSDGEVSEEE